MIKKLFLVLIISLALFSSLEGVSANPGDVDPLINPTTEEKKIDCSKDTDNCEVCGNCSLNSFMLTLVKGSQIILGLSGSFALLAFVVGGLMFLLSAGNSTWVERGKSTIFGAAIGLAIVMLSWVVIYFVLTKVFNLTWSGSLVTY